ncbi:flagellar protein FlgN [Rariglobus hedericola]|uniref:Flagellar protein FlgN n=1 Tax=Rariglobus hedericola TaxID=2597822 RepID=A0A556QPQ2_9BACT|nr:flagellar protein FlgN [Rariglobus hedericola]TSJ78628.1 flagellar protein FlgN [Rariglobus hedericola]
MHPDWEILVENLRSELQAYGGLLQLFTEQQDNLLRGDPDAVLSYAHEIEAQVRVTAELRDRREDAVQHFAESKKQPATSTLRQLLSLFPDEVRPLLSALIDEINHLIRRVRNGVKRNHQMIHRAMEIHQDTLRALRPAAFTRTYSPHGSVSIGGEQPAWQAAG